MHENFFLQNYHTKKKKKSCHAAQSLTFNAQDTHSEVKGLAQEQLDSNQDGSEGWQSGYCEAKSTSGAAPNANTSVFVLLLINRLFNLASVC